MHSAVSRQVKISELFAARIVVIIDFLGLGNLDFFCEAPNKQSPNPG